MSETIVIAEEDGGTGREFSWGLAIAGGVAAVAVTFFLLTLGSGFGLMLVRPTSSAPAFFTGGAIFFFIAQAFGFAVGGHLAGRLLGPIAESHAREEFRAAAHGFMSWAVAVAATLVIVALVAIAAASNAGLSTAAVYGMSAAKTTDVTPTGYLVDKLFRPGGPGSETARGEAARIVDTGLTRGEQLAPDDRDRLSEIVSRQAGISRDAAASRVDAMQADLRAKTKEAADRARRAASYASLWIAFSLLFGAILATASAVMARNEDDRRSWLAV